MDPHNFYLMHRKHIRLPMWLQETSVDKKKTKSCNFGKIWNTAMFFFSMIASEYRLPRRLLEIISLMKGNGY